MQAGYIIFGFGLLLLVVSYILFRLANRPQGTIVNARELDALWTSLGKLMVQVQDGNTNIVFLKDLDHITGKCYNALARQSKNEFAENNKKQLMSRMKELEANLKDSPIPYKIEIRKHRLYNIAKLINLKMPKKI